MASFGYAQRGYHDAGMPDPAVLPEAYAGVLWRRTLAYFVDLVCIGALAIPFCIVFAVLWLLSFGLLGPALPRERTVAVTPIVGGRALKGPTVEMLLALGKRATPEQVATEYRGVAAGYVLDEVDRNRAPAIEALGYRVLVTDTVMPGAGEAGRLAADILDTWR